MTRLISAYLGEADRAVSELRSISPLDDLLAARRNGKIPKEGVLPSGGAYSFHGSGCRFERPDGSIIDVDFGPDGRADGFDAWRLHAFARSSRFGDFDLQDIESALQSSEASGELIRPSLHPSPHLFFLRKAAEGTGAEEGTGRMLGVDRQAPSGHVL